MSGRSSATDSVTDLTDLTDVRKKFGNGFCNGFNGCQEEGRRKKTYIASWIDRYVTFD
jgi:hypothetical protein